MPLSRLEEELRNHVKTYQEYNSSQCAELWSTPTALEFHRFVAANRPVVIRGQGHRDQIPALERWSDEYLVDAMGEKQVDVSVDPTGNADSIVDGYFVEPANVKMTLPELLARLGQDDDQGPVWYAQSQSGNLSDEYAPLRDDVGSEGPAWAREALGEPPDVANIWIGGERSKTSLHKDPYENIYLVVRGSKEFILLPPSEAYCLHERTYPHATWSYSPPLAPARATAQNSFTLVPTCPRVEIPWIPVDPLQTPQKSTKSKIASSSSHDDYDEDEDDAENKLLFPRYAFARPVRVTVHAGDMLYLPSLWFHHVSQTPRYHDDDDDDDRSCPPSSPNDATKTTTTSRGTKATIAVNWWFDMKFDGPAYSAFELTRTLIKLVNDHDDDDRRDDRRRETLNLERPTS